MLLWLLYTTVVLTAFVGMGLLLYLRKRLQERQARLKPMPVRAHREY